MITYSGMAVGALMLVCPIIMMIVTLMNNNDNKTKVICANSKFESRNVTVGEVA